MSLDRIPAQPHPWTGPGRGGYDSPLRLFAWIPLAAAFAAFAFHLSGRVELPLAALAYFPVSLLTACFYGFDKARARRSGRRIRERTLHLLELAGGWPGALWAQGRLRHKTRDRGFRLVFWVIVALHAALWAGWLALR